MPGFFGEASQERMIFVVSVYEQGGPGLLVQLVEQGSVLLVDGVAPGYAEIAADDQVVLFGQMKSARFQNLGGKPGFDSESVDVSGEVQHDTRSFRGFFEHVGLQRF